MIFCTGSMFVNERSDARKTRAFKHNPRRIGSMERQRGLLSQTMSGQAGDVSGQR